MRGTIIVSCVAAGALLSSLASAARPPMVLICHLDDGVFEVIRVIQNAVPAHLSKHGDVYPGSWWPDADGDGYGDPGVEPRPCPQDGLVDNDDDCDDGDASVNPGEEEVCGDGIDQECDGLVDDGCVPECPCFTQELITQHFEERLYVGEFAGCVSIYQEWYTTEWELAWEHRAWIVFGSSEGLEVGGWVEEEDEFSSRSSSEGYDDPIGMSYCRGVSGGFSDDGFGNRYDEWNDYTSVEVLTEEQHTACTALLMATADALDLTCWVVP